MEQALREIAALAQRGSSLTDEMTTSTALVEIRHKCKEALGREIE